MEIWLRTNARALLFGMVPPALLGLMGLVLSAGVADPPRWMRGLGIALVVLSLAMVALLAWQLRRPRLAYRDGQLLVWLRSGSPIRMPIEVVECFLLGQAPSFLPGDRQQRTEATALVVRIADRASEWHQQDVKPQLGKWCGGYITIRGTWCEPLHVELVNRLNQRLADVTRAPARS